MAKLWNWNHVPFPKGRNSISITLIISIYYTTITVGIQRTLADNPLRARFQNKMHICGLYMSTDRCNVLSQCQRTGVMCYHNVSVQIGVMCYHNISVQIGVKCYHNVSVQIGVMCYHNINVQIGVMCYHNVSVQIGATCYHNVSVQIGVMCYHNVSVQIGVMCYHNVSVNAIPRQYVKMFLHSSCIIRCSSSVLFMS